MPSLRLDDSGHEGSTKVLVAAGYIGPVEAWDAFEIEWERVSGGTVLHMADLCGEIGHGEFKGWSQADRAEFANQMGRTINKHLRHGVARSISVDDYKDLLIPEAEMFLQGTDARQLYAIAWVLRMILEWVALNWAKGDDAGKARLAEHEKVDLIFEEGTKGLGEAITYCRNLKRSREWAKIFGHIGTDSKENLVSLQAADFLAWHVYKFRDAQRMDRLPYTTPESLKLSIIDCELNWGHLPRNHIPDMLDLFRIQEMVSNHPI